MEVVRGFEHVKHESGTAVTVGSFDGLHLGHQRILQAMREHNDGAVTVMTFDPHPQTVVHPFSDLPPLLTTFDERIELFRKFGVDKLIIVHFDEDFAEISADYFVEYILVEHIGISSIFVGPQHGFGAGRRGGVKMLNRIGKQLGFEVKVVQPVVRDGVFVSSSRIRNCLKEGDAYAALRYMGHPFYIIGEVVSGDKRGKELGFPTANLKLPQNMKLSPPAGVYASITEIDRMRFPSVCHIGARPTFKGATASIETHIIGFNGDIYGKRIKVGLIEKLREVRSFSSPDELVEQITRDRDQASISLIEKGFGALSKFEERRFGKFK